MRLDDIKHCFYTPGKPGIIDIAIDCDGVFKGGYSGDTLEQIQARNPGAALGDFDTVCAASDDFYKRPPVVIDEARYAEMLEVLPPEQWARNGHTESFKLGERTSGNITAIFCRIGERHFEMQDSVFMKHDAIVHACSQVPA